jgi:hypothetical protein
MVVKLYGVPPASPEASPCLALPSAKRILKKGRELCSSISCTIIRSHSPKPAGDPSDGRWCYNEAWDLVDLARVIEECETEKAAARAANGWSAKL